VGHVLQSQVDAQAAMLANTDLTLFDYQALGIKISTLVNDFPEAEKRVRDLETSKALMESKNDSNS
jgi:hypothetical protein